MGESRSLLPLRYRPQDDHVAQSNEPYDVECGLERLTSWMIEDVQQDAQHSAIQPVDTTRSGGPAAEMGREGEVRGTTEAPPTDVRFLTVAEVATVMRVSKMTVYRLVHSGELEAVRVGRSFRVPEAAISQYLRSAFAMNG